ncbi:tryptophanase [Saccharopolyspora sp. NFXS83]|uniref:tryptophanase n=1 Tax=Saccharopolyspora sp. NFXS83 TaxID=2993560 RepID=UPI00224AB1DB|nr:tryptophanase [Saccharopolyspora sp. NFXS83]MCX2730791.1 tryptophanase [Saccharopolyspora sp. NFXS83]
MLDFPTTLSAVVKPAPALSREEREREIERAGYNPFKIDARTVSVDFLSDSGTGALSTAQRAAAEQADESYACSSSWYRFEESVRDLVPYQHVFPVHQGRAAERVLFSSLLSPGQISISNTHFDTTRANVEIAGGRALDLPCPASSDLDSDFPFKGDIDLSALERTLSGPEGSKVGIVLMTITNNGLGGQPVSLANMTAAAEIARRHGVPFWLDAARFAENAWLITRREPGYSHWDPRDVARREFALADGCMISLKKDGLGHAGGLLAMRDDALAERCKALVIAGEGFVTYGGISGRDLEVVAQGLREVTDPQHLAGRESAAALLAELSHQAGVSTVRPSGMHAIYLNAGRLLTHLTPAEFPGHALACELYRRGGIRAAELGSLYLGELDDDLRLREPAPFELVRLAIPRRSYDETHLRFVGSVLDSIAKDPEQVPGYRLTEAPPLLRHFDCRLKPLRN